MRETQLLWNLQARFYKSMPWAAGLLLSVTRRAIPRTGRSFLCHYWAGTFIQLRTGLAIFSAEGCAVAELCRRSTWDPNDFQEMILHPSLPIRIVLQPPGDHLSFMFDVFSICLFIWLMSVIQSDIRSLNYNVALIYSWQTSLYIVCITCCNECSVMICPYLCKVASWHFLKLNQARFHMQRLWMSSSTVIIAVIRNYSIWSLRLSNPLHVGLRRAVNQSQVQINGNHSSSQWDMSKICQGLTACNHSTHLRP